MLDTFASRFEFQHRTWFILGIFCVGLAYYSVDPQNSGVVLASVLRSHVSYLQTFSPQTSIRILFLVGAFIVALGGLIRAWGTDIVQDKSEVIAERTAAISITLRFRMRLLGLLSVYSSV